MSSTVWAVRAAHIWRREAHIFRFLRDAQCAVRIVEVRLFKTSRLSDRVPMDTRRWEPGNDLEKKPRRSRSTSQTVDGSMPRLWRQRNLNRSRHTGRRLVGSAQRWLGRISSHFAPQDRVGEMAFLTIRRLTGTNSPHRRRRSRQRDCSDVRYTSERDSARAARGLRNMLASTPSRRYVRAGDPDARRLASCVPVARERQLG
jgi:hypothetical protein